MNFARSFSTRASVKLFKNIPHHKSLPIIGDLQLVKELGKARAGEEYILSKLSKELGDICKIRFMGQYMVVLNDPDAVKELYRNEGYLPSRFPVNERNHKWIHENSRTSKGLAMAYQNDWKRLRVAMTKQVTPRRMRHFTQPFYEVTDNLCSYITSIQDSDGWVADIRQPMERWSFKGIVKVIFNEDFDPFSGNDPRAEVFIKAAHKASDAFNKINIAVPLYKIFPTRPYKQFLNAGLHLRKLGKELLNNHYESLRKDIEMGTVNEDIAVGLLDQWLIEGKLTEDEAVTQACDMLGVAVDSTSSAATFLLHEIAKNPEIQEAMQKEIAKVVGLHACPTAEQLQNLTLVRKCVKEMLRLHPLVAILSRGLANDAVILGYQIPAGTTCLVNHFAMGMDSRYFKEPTKFDPDRWSHESTEIHPYASLQFGFGPRGCYGRRIAELELHVLLTRIMQKFKLSTDQTTLKRSFHAVLRSAEPVRLKFYFQC